MVIAIRSQTFRERRGHLRLKGMQSFSQITLLFLPMLKTERRIITKAVPPVRMTHAGTSSI